MEACVFFDGAARNNGTSHAEAAYGYVLKDVHGSLLNEGNAYLGRVFTSNGAEYKGLIAGLQKARSLGVRIIHIYGDSELICNQVTGIYSVRNPRLRVYCETVHKLLRCFDDYSVQHRTRNENTRADQLANQAFNHDSQRYTWNRSKAIRMSYNSDSAWTYVLKERIYGYFRVQFLLGIFEQYNPDVYDNICDMAWNMDHVDWRLENEDDVVCVLVTA